MREICPFCEGYGGIPIHVCGGNEELCYRQCPDFDRCPCGDGFIRTISARRARYYRRRGLHPVFSHHTVNRKARYFSVSQAQQERGD